MLEISELWSFIEENESFFRKITVDSEFSIDFKKNKYAISGVSFADPFMLITRAFRHKFSKMGQSKDHEYTRISKMLYSAGTKLPLSRKEYDEQISFEDKNQAILYVIEEHMGAKDNTFMIPTKEHANSLYRNASENIEKILSDMFIYSGKKARYYVDIYDRLSGFEVHVGESSIFIPSRNKNIGRSALYEDRLRSANEDTTVTICSMSDIDAVDRVEHMVFVSIDYPESVKNISKYFRKFDILSDDTQFASLIAKELTRNSDDSISVTINGTNSIESLYTKVIAMYLSDSTGSIPYILDIAKVIAVYTKAEREIFVSGLSPDIPEDVIAILRPYVDGNDDSHEAKISDMIDEDNIELSAKIIKSNGDSSSVLFYNKEMRYFKEFQVDRTGVINEFIPDLGGFRYISLVCGINRDKVPSGYTTIDSYIAALVLKIIQREFARLPLFQRFVSSGVHVVGEIPFFAHKSGVYGTGGRHSVDGVLVNSPKIEPAIPRAKYSKRQSNMALHKVVAESAGFITNDAKEHELFALMCVSSLISPMLQKVNKFTISVVGANKYTKEGLVHAIFKGVFRNAIPIKTDSGYVINQTVDGSSSILVVEDDKEISKSIYNISRERIREETIVRSRNSNKVFTMVNAAPLVVFTEKPWLMEDSIVFNFKPRVASSPDSILYDFEDLSGGIATYIVSNYRRIKQLEEKFISFAKKKVRTDEIVDKSAYVDFFEKIIPAMCLVELLDYRPGVDFYTDMMAVFFNTSRIKSSIRIDKLLLRLKHKKGFMEDKLFDASLRENQKGDVVYVDTVFHKAYVDKENTDMYIFVFDGVEVFKKIRKEIDMSYVEFSSAIRSYEKYVDYDNSVKNWRLGSNKSKSVHSAYRENFRGIKENFFAVRISKNEIT